MRVALRAIVLTDPRDFAHSVLGKRPGCEGQGFETSRLALPLARRVDGPSTRRGRTGSGGWPPRGSSCRCSAKTSTRVLPMRRRCARIRRRAAPSAQQARSAAPSRHRSRARRPLRDRPQLRRAILELTRQLVRLVGCVAGVRRIPRATDAVFAAALFLRERIFTPLPGVRIARNHEASRLCRDRWKQDEDVSAVVSCRR